MKSRIIILFLSLCLLQIGCTEKEKENVVSLEETKTESTNFWAHRYNMEKDVIYGDDPAHRLDIYTHGEKKGEPIWFVRDEDKKPTLIFIHGGGWVAGNKETAGSFFPHYLERGWNVVNVEYRIGAGTAPDAAEDTLMVMKWVADNAEDYKIDTNKIVISGASAGGHLALLAGLINTVPKSHPYYIGDKLRIQAIVNWFGITNIKKVENYLRTHHPDWNYPIGWIKDENKIDEISKSYSPIHYVTKNSPPILTIHGDLDEVVPYNQAQLLHDRLEKAGSEHQLLTLKGGKHMGFTEEQFQLIYKTIFEFLEAHP